MLQQEKLGGGENECVCLAAQSSKTSCMFSLDEPVTMTTAILIGQGFVWISRLQYRGYWWSSQRA